MSDTEQTLSIIKPDAVERNLENEIKEMFKNEGFKILKENHNQKIDKKFVNQIDNEFKENMLSDIQTYYFKNFEIFHKIKSDLKSLDSLVNPNQ